MARSMSGLQMWAYAANQAERLALSDLHNLREDWSPTEPVAHGSVV